MSQRDMVRAAVDRDKQRDVTPLRSPGGRRQRHRKDEEDACIYCGAPIVDDELLRMACPALLGQPLPTHARPGMRVKVGELRQGWRGRLANVESLLSEAKEALHDDDSGAYHAVAVALAEVRSMIDENGQ